MTIIDVILVIAAASIVILLIIYCISIAENESRKKENYKDEKKYICGNYPNNIQYITLDELKKYYFINHHKWHLGYCAFPVYVYKDENGEDVPVYCIIPYNEYEEYKSFRKEAVNNPKIDSKFTAAFLNDIQSDIDKQRNEIISSMNKEYELNRRIIESDFNLSKENQ